MTTREAVLLTGSLFWLSGVICLFLSGLDSKSSPNNWRDHFKWKSEVVKYWLCTLIWPVIPIVITVLWMIILLMEQVIGPIIDKYRFNQGRWKIMEQAVESKEKSK